MKYLIFLLFPLSVMAAPISFDTPVYNAANNIIIQRGANLAGDDFVFVYYEITGFGNTIIKNCAITKVSEFLDVINVKQNALKALFAQTPHGVKWSWTTTIPANLHPWCIQ